MSFTITAGRSRGPDEEVRFVPWVSVALTQLGAKAWLRGTIKAVYKDIARFVNSLPKGIYN